MYILKNANLSKSIGNYRRIIANFIAITLMLCTKRIIILYGSPFLR